MTLYFYTLRDNGVKFRESEATPTVTTYRRFGNPPDGFYRTSIKQDEIAEVIERNTVVLLEKNDMLAKEIFSRHLLKEITCKQIQIDVMKKQLETVKDGKIIDKSRAK